MEVPNRNQRRLLSTSIDLGTVASLERECRSGPLLLDRIQNEARYELVQEGSPGGEVRVVACAHSFDRTGADGSKEIEVSITARAWRMAGTVPAFFLSSVDVGCSSGLGVRSTPLVPTVNPLAKRQQWGVGLRIH